MRLTKIRALSIVLAVGASTVGANIASAAPINCPGTAATTDREFTIDTAVTATCTAYGSGPFAGGGEGFLLDTGFALIDKVDGGDSSGLLNGALSIVGLGTLGGSFTINAAVWTMFDTIAFTLQSGTGVFNPDWVVFTLANGTTGGSWSIGPAQAGALSNATIWGRGSPTQVPEPGALSLLGAALAGLALIRRRRSIG
jgi:hypothetical protein